MIDLQAIFGDGPTVAVELARVPEVVPDAAIEAARLQPFLWWVRCPDSRGRMGWQAPDLPEVIRFDDLPEPGPACAVCGSLESWQDAIGRQRCGRCDAGILDKARELADMAKRLRQQAQRWETAPRIAPGCVAPGMVDMLDPDGKRPAQGQLEGFGGA